MFSDGIYEIERSEGKFWELESFIAMLRNHHASRYSLDKLLAEVCLINGGDDFADDLSIMQIDFG